MFAGNIGVSQDVESILNLALQFKFDNRVKFVSLDILLKESDIITPHCPLNDESKEMFNKETFYKIKDGAFFINTARGGIVNENDLANALLSGKLSGAAIDVLNEEPMSYDCLLKDIPNLTITPHTAWAPLATRERLIKIAESNIISYLNGSPTNKVN